MVKPDGIMFVATINRTLKALGLAIIGAEYVLRWLPRGTHQYGKLVRPEELEKALGDAGMTDHRPHRRHLQSACRPLAALEGHGRQLHGAGGKGPRPPDASGGNSWPCAFVVMMTPTTMIDSARPGQQLIAFAEEQRAGKQADGGRDIADLAEIDRPADRLQPEEEGKHRRGRRHLRDDHQRHRRQRREGRPPSCSARMPTSSIAADARWLPTASSIGPVPSGQSTVR